MKRRTCSPRKDWPRIVESQGFLFHSAPDAYWDESAFYEFTQKEIDVLDEATQNLHDMCLQVVPYVIKHNLFDQLAIPHDWVNYVIASWENQHPTVYGRFDFSWGGNGPPKLLEYNADTPTSLLEAAVIQWYWLQDTHPQSDQFNSIHERLIDVWREIRHGVDDTLYFSAVEESLEDYVTVTYLRDTAIQVGLTTEALSMEQVGWDHKAAHFVDGRERPIRFMFKLYPWEFMAGEEFGRYILHETTRWFEPAWKMILSNKGVLALLWEMFPDHPNLLRAEFEPFSNTYVRKPLLSREGANIQVVFDGREFLHTEGMYPGPYVYQDVCPLPKFDDRFAAIGSWIIGATACGMGIRESPDLITRNTSRFVPHLFNHDYG